MVMNREEVEYHLKNVEKLDDFLINRGVKNSDLDAAMNEKVDYATEFDYYYDYKEKQTNKNYFFFDILPCRHAALLFPGHSE